MTIPLWGYIKSVSKQYLLMLRKDYLVFKRKWKLTLLQMISPLFFVLVIYLIDVGLRSSSKVRERLDVEKHYDTSSFPLIPRCRGDRCYTIGYTPTGGFYDTIISDIATSNDVPMDEVKGWSNQTEMDTFIFNNQNKTQGAYIFNTLIMTLPTDIDYTIVYNKSVVCSRRADCNNPILNIVSPMQYHMDRRIFKETFGSSAALTAQRIKMPRKGLSDFDAIGAFGQLFFFLAFMFHFIVFESLVVQEKENKLKLSLTIMGLQEFSYWLSWITISTAILFISVIVLVTSGLAFGFEFFVENNFFLYFLLFFLTGEGILMMAFFFSAFLKKSRVATPFGFAFFLIFYVGNILAVNIVYSNSIDVWPWLRVVLMLLPPVVLAKGLNDFAEQSTGSDNNGISWSERSSYTDIYPMTTLYNYAILDFFMYWILLWYFNNIIAGEWGTARKPWFFLVPSYWGYTSKKPKNIVAGKEPTYKEDVDVALERDQMKDPEKHGRHLALHIQNLTKTFWSDSIIRCHKKRAGFTAVDGVSFGMDEGTLLCLLGPNGAGKTTTFNMLTGVFPPTSGTAILKGGYSIGNDIDEIRHHIGVCPQHDILWDELTGEEHLHLFAGLKGLEKHKILPEVEKRLDQVKLRKFGAVPSGTYSGGMQRRLSVAISMIADPSILYLDEPTTGMDPVARRQVWDMIVDAKKGRSILLTTHSMEEADVLGDRIVIQAKGHVRCIGTSLHLKNRFGSGFRVTFTVQPDLEEELDRFVRESVEGVTVVSDVKAFITYQIPRRMKSQMFVFFERIENHPQLSRLQFTVSMATLEEVFIRISRESRVDGEEEEEEQEEEQEEQEEEVDKVKAKSLENEIPSHKE